VHSIGLIKEDGDFVFADVAFHVRFQSLAIHLERFFHRIESLLLHVEKPELSQMVPTILSIVCLGRIANES